MGRIMTVCGEIDSKELGWTTMHEHTIFAPIILTKIMLQSMPDMAKGIGAYQGGADLGVESRRRKEEHLDDIPQMNVKAVISSMRMPRNNPARKLKDVEYYINELKAFREAGGNALCDCSPLPFAGISPAKRQEISRRSGVHIIVPAGYYVKCTIPRKDIRHGEAWMQRKVERYLDAGDEKSGVKPGFVKCAVSCVENDAVSPRELMAIRACARAAKSRGMCLHMHTAFPVRRHMVLELADMFEKEIGLSPDRVLFCHMDSYNLGMGNPCAHINADGYEIDLPVELARRGFYIGLDTWEGSSGYALEARKKMLLDLISRGFVSQITLGHDMKSRAAGVQNHSTGYVTWPQVLREMQQKGNLSEADILQMAVKTPESLLTIRRAV